MNKTTFLEDSRKFKPLVILLTCICFFVFIILTTLKILNLLGLIKELYDGIFYMPAAFIFLAMGCYGIWSLCSKYLKHYLSIKENKIEFYYNGENKQFLYVDFNGYEVVNKASWIMGGYWTFELSFANTKYTIQSFKGKELENVLKLIIDQNNRYKN